ncbi:MAG TPA: phosphate transport system regulatory protein PhoU [Deltaproteobacteria bacterium]|nr:MAG: phosphate transport system regulatory protein PhoU [Deltaproteobacteria bacterium GWA2_55_82]OGQ62571.1 MAG: phosphate transport system regulatory protein PhoU [Deltaproteobacteria bacterium RIFCSPLOWO2_02_FULL_55_12]OIJ74159.1 MAG: phosphate transport system regulatory protein PhoU [Deltaproteobacteria bacterium GWC2_55_46]HBG46779.1 phosphate transport system regulatory protein PhoU [Deltaproteobacteria bacterium]HCY11212.1 phosphate transport system regulatory protein PhoU [Deltaprot
MTREAYHRAITELEGEVQRMAAMVDTAIKGSIEALKARDLERSRQIVQNDIEVNRKRFEIEEKCIRLIATQQPMAVDLRILAAIINIITDLERIGDHAEGIAKISLAIGNEPLVKPLVDMPKMAEKATSMLERCMKAFIERDIETARNICNEDDVVDAYYDTIYNDLVLLMIENPKLIKDATYLIWAAHNIERIADRVTNIAERVVYMVTGKMEEMNVSKY